MIPFMPDLMDLIHHSLFYQISAIMMVAGIIGFIGLKLKQPLIVAFIAAGLLVGPDLLNIVPAESKAIDTLAELGIALLLLMVGLKLDLTLIRTLGGVALATGLGQVLFTALFGFVICLGFGLGVVPSLYVAVALTFSSTIIIVKLLSDKHEIDSLHGRIALGFLIVQDIFVVLCMVILSAFGIGAGGNGGIVGELMMVLLNGAALVGFILIFIAKIATPLMTRLAHSPELMTTFAVAWAAALAALADIMGFSIELGGLLAGVSLASTPFRDILASRLSSLRDFMLLFFFIALGSKINLDILGAQLIPAAALSVFVLVGNPLIVMAIMGFMGYGKRTGFLAGLTVAQISEFSLIFMAMGITLGHVGEDMLGLVTLVGLVTISLSTYMITYSQHLYTVCEPFLSPFERKKNRHKEDEGSTARRGKAYDIVLFGLGRYGSEIARDCLDRGASVLAFDFDPGVVRSILADGKRNKNLGVGYGDVTDPDSVRHLPLETAKWVICAVPHHQLTLQDEDFRLTLIGALKDHPEFQGKIAVVSHHADEAERLRKAGADLILTPFPDAAKQAVRNILGDKETA